MSNIFNKFIPIIFIAAVFLLGSQFMVNSLGSMDANSNVSSEYQGQYNNTRDVSIVTISIAKYIPFLLIIMSLIVTVMYLAKKRNRY